MLADLPEMEPEAIQVIDTPAGAVIRAPCVGPLRAFRQQHRSRRHRVHRERRSVRLEERAEDVRADPGQHTFGVRDADWSTTPKDRAIKTYCEFG